MPAKTVEKHETIELSKAYASELNEDDKQKQEQDRFDLLDFYFPWPYDEIDEGHKELLLSGHYVH